MWFTPTELRFQVGSGPLSTWIFTSRHQVGGELWRQVEPVPVPLLAPKHGESSVSRSSSGSDSLINCSAAVIAQDQILTSKER